MAVPQIFKAGDRVKVSDENSPDVDKEGKIVSQDPATAKCDVLLDGEKTAKTFGADQLEKALV
jgi:hypothetical protein